MTIAGDLSFDLFGISVGYYGLCIVLGIAAGMLLGRGLCRANGIDFDDFIQLVCVCGLFAILGAKLLYVIISLPSIDLARLTDPNYLSGLVNGGFVFYGGLGGALVGVVLCRRVLKIDAWGIARACVPCLPLAHGFGRIGCLLAGCCYGVPYDGLLHVRYEHSPIAPNGISLFPVQGAEALLNFVVAGVLLVYASRSHGRRCLELYLLLYAIERFFLEFLRFDDTERGVFGALSTSQWICVVVAVVTLALLWRQTHAARTRRRRSGTHAPATHGRPDADDASDLSSTLRT